MYTSQLFYKLLETFSNTNIECDRKSGQKSLYHECFGRATRSLISLFHWALSCVCIQSFHSCRWWRKGEKQHAHFSLRMQPKSSARNPSTLLWQAIIFSHHVFLLLLFLPPFHSSCDCIWPKMTIGWCVSCSDTIRKANQHMEYFHSNLMNIHMIRIFILIEHNHSVSLV